MTIFDGHIHYYCDNCGQETDPSKLYIVKDDELCCNCILKKYKTVAQVEDEERRGSHRLQMQYAAEFMARTIKPM